MEWPQASIVVQTYFTKKWGGRTPISYPNVRDPQFPIKDGRPWIRIDSIDYGISFSSLGRTKQLRHTGVIFFTIFTPKGSGTGLIENLFQKLMKTFRFKRVDGITFDGKPSSANKANDIGHGYYASYTGWGFEYLETVDIENDELDQATDLNFFSGSSSGNIALF